jgi:hypothetical protein
MRICAWVALHALSCSAALQAAAAKNSVNA